MQKCNTVRQGTVCPFMTKAGCDFEGGCQKIIEKCEGCNRASEFASGWYCSTYPDPNARWKNGACNQATHIVAAKSDETKKVNPLKASKRARR